MCALCACASAYVHCIAIYAYVYVRMCGDALTQHSVLHSISLDLQPWFYKAMDRPEAERLLRLVHTRILHTTLHTMVDLCCYIYSAFRFVTCYSHHCLFAHL